MKLFIKRLLSFVFIIICGVTLLFSGTYLYLSPQLPSTETLKDIQFQTPLKIFSADGKLISEFGEKRRIPLKYNDIPETLINAILAAEDDQFFHHSGVSFKGLARAALEIAQTGSIKSGGSTITMQVAKNFFLSRERNFKRKFNEILLAFRIEQRLSKEEILALYINKIYLGHRAYGFGAAAKVYYGKNLAELDLAQTATLASLPKAPSTANPITNPTKALIRRNWILNRMRQLKLISRAAFEKAESTPQSAIFHRLKTEISAPYAAEMVRKEIVNTYGEAAYRDGYIVTTTLVSNLQNSANRAVRNGLITYDKRHGYRNSHHTAHSKITGTDNRTTNKAPHSGDIQPAHILSVGETLATAQLNNGDVVEIHREQLGWKKSYVDANHQKELPDKLSELLYVNDRVYVTPIKQTNYWALAQFPKAQAALVSLKANNGAILSLVGGFDFSLSKYNRATQAKRQAGSNIKPFIYSAALNSGFTPASIINDAPVVFDDPNLEQAWRPENSGGRFFGPTRLRKALYLSRNLVSVRILRTLGINNAIRYAQQFGFPEESLPHDLSLALGSAGITPLEMATAYASLANGGYKINPYIIEKIETNNGEIIFQAEPYTVCTTCLNTAKKPTVDSENAISHLTAPETTPPLTTNTGEQPHNPAPRIMDERVNYLINSILKDVINRGTGYAAKKIKRNDIAGKTGTTNNLNDAWFSGYNSEIITSVWVGFDKPNTLGRREYGSRAALPIWLEHMSYALEGTPVIQQQQPEGLVTIRINPDTGEAAQPSDKGAIFETFRIENAPALKAVNKNSFDSPKEEDDELQQLF